MPRRGEVFMRCRGLKLSFRRGINISCFGVDAGLLLW